MLFVQLRATQGFGLTSVVCKMDDVDELQDERFVEIMRGFPCLYDYKSKGYHDRIRKANAWGAVSTQVGLTVYSCKKRWKSIRDKYRRELHRAEEESGPTWEMLPLLEFLKPFTSRRQNSSINEDAPGSIVSWSLGRTADTHHFTDTVESSDDCGAAFDSMLNTSDGSARNSLKRRLQLPDETANDITTTMRSFERIKQRCLSDDDCFVPQDISYNQTRHFLLSLIGDVLSLSDDRQTEFKVRVWKLMAELKREQQSAAGST